MNVNLFVLIGWCGMVVDWHYFFLGTMKVVCCIRSFCDSQIKILNVLNTNRKAKYWQLCLLPSPCELHSKSGMENMRLYPQHWLLGRKLSLRNKGISSWPWQLALLCWEVKRECLLHLGVLKILSITFSWLVCYFLEKESYALKT